MKEYGNDWIITESNSENADIYFYRFTDERNNGNI